MARTRKNTAVSNASIVLGLLGTVSNATCVKKNIEYLLVNRSKEAGLALAANGVEKSMTAIKAVILPIMQAVEGVSNKDAGRLTHNLTMKILRNTWGFYKIKGTKISRDGDKSFEVRTEKHDKLITNSLTFSQEDINKAMRALFG